MTTSEEPTCCDGGMPHPPRSRGWGWGIVGSAATTPDIQRPSRSDLVERLQEVYLHLEEGARSPRPHHALTQCRMLIADIIVALDQDASESGGARIDDLLTDREMEIARAVGAGMPNRAIGQELWISETTVKFHLRNVMRKLGLATGVRWRRSSHERGLIGSAVDGHEHSESRLLAPPATESSSFVANAMNRTAVVMASPRAWCGVWTGKFICSATNSSDTL